MACGQPVVACGFISSFYLGLFLGLLSKRERERESLLLLDFSLDASHARVAQFTLK